MPGLSVALYRCSRKSMKVKEDMEVVLKTLVMKTKKEEKTINEVCKRKRSV